MGDLHALRLAGGARGVDDVGEVLVANARASFLRLAASDPLGVAVEDHRAPTLPGQAVRCRAIGDQDRHPRVVQESPATFLRPRRIQGEVSAPRFPDGQDGDHLVE